MRLCLGLAVIGHFHGTGQTQEKGVFSSMDFSDFITPENVEHAMNSLEIILYESWPGRMPPEFWDVIRRYVLWRDGYTCSNCKATDTRLDAHHIVPLSVGGTNHTSNIKTLCFECHCKIHPHMVKVANDEQASPVRTKSNRTASRSIQV